MGERPQIVGDLTGDLMNLTWSVNQAAVEPLLRMKGFKQDRFKKNHFSRSYWWQFWHFQGCDPLLIVGQVSWAYIDTMGNHRCGYSTESLVGFLEAL